MHRTQLLSLLEQYRPIDPQERVAKERIEEFVKQYPDCFERSLLIGHITASAWLINHDGSAALLMHHAKLNKWLQLGGHCDGNPDVLAVALKEACEESGLAGIKPIRNDIFDLDIHTIPEHKGIPAHIHYDIRFLLQATRSDPIQINHESKALRWIEKTCPIFPTHERSVVRLFEKWQNFK